MVAENGPEALIGRGVTGLQAQKLPASKLLALSNGTLAALGYEVDPKNNHATTLSDADFARLFKGATGQTPHQYVLRCRMARAKHLLTETTLPLHEIGARVGYADQSHFTALFRQYVATTPKAHRDAASRV